jgi:F0F1-type ATP synthase membrane subunit c/vacuolar-type H+-ATPase subunit K
MPAVLRRSDSAKRSAQPVVLIFVGIAVGLAGCASGSSTAQAERQAMLAAALQQQKDEQQACTTAFSESDRDAIARAKCINAADEKFRPTTTYPDLVSLRMAKRAELAERQAAGKITRAQFVLEYSQLNSQIESEWQSRTNSDRSANAQETSAVAARSQAISAASSTPNPFTPPMPNPCPILVGGRCSGN